VSLNKLFSEWTENEDAQEGDKKMQGRESRKEKKTGTRARGLEKEEIWKIWPQIE
jgi:hypothetical protein